MQAAPRTLGFDASRRLSAPRRAHARARRPDTLERLGRFIGRIHAVGAIAPFAHRPALDIASFGESRATGCLRTVSSRPTCCAAWTGIVEQALDASARLRSRGFALRDLRLHGDCHAGNVLWTDDGPHFVDFDDARTGPAVQDLWMLLSGDRADMSGSCPTCWPVTRIFATSTVASCS
jgi:Ser/Thr protein kinase RdoA (MazF antagonist)